jgi:hypothetical protein
MTIAVLIYINKCPDFPHARNPPTYEAIRGSTRVYVDF